MEPSNLLKSVSTARAEVVSERVKRAWPLLSRKQLTPLPESTQPRLRSPNRSVLRRKRLHKEAAERSKSPLPTIQVKLPETHIISIDSVPVLRRPMQGGPERVPMESSSPNSRFFMSAIRPIRQSDLQLRKRRVLNRLFAIRALRRSFTPASDDGGSMQADSRARL